MSFPPPIPGSSQQPLSIPSSANSNHSYGPTGTSFPRQTDYGGPSQQGGPSRWDGLNHSHQNGGGDGAGMVSGISAMMRSRGNDDYLMTSSPPGGAHSSLSSNPHSGFHPSSYGPNLPFSALALGVSMHNGHNSYMGGNNMGMSISPPHWGSFGSGSFVGSVGAFGTSLNREREGRERELEAKYVRDFSCCGKKLNGLHELLEHYEEEHANLAPDVRMAAINAAQSSMSTAGLPPRNVSNPFSPIPPTPTSIGQQTHHHHHQSDVPAPPGMMDIEMEEPAYPAAAGGSLAQLQQQQQQQNQSFQARPLAFNNIAANPWAAAFRPQMLANQNQPQCVPPSLLSYAPPTPGPSTPGGGSGALTPEQLQAKALRKAQRKAEKAAREEASPDDAEGEKRFPCPIEGCGKVYKQANGLKYHLTRSINSGHGNVAALGGLAALLGEKGGEADG
ncbi:hypothetical protein I317_04889 [Kwoniella heveanensis CBS 569]|uniref:C2H2-type domain-containing protein n=1 Tax=Kwoniella heveanensis BCC8398 TaxID=1296120 RepID=A0A1B9GWU3_9TREE|nr:hypothetical protein I316_03035 [Kwoniella heveanensis BCC8398]OCF41317.1 hypothetical protein I317_04889 [Kwoniella heveanensis CBS 569]